MPVVAQTWIDGAFELGFVRERRTQRTRLFAIERFLTASDNPGQITAVQGLRLTPEEHHRAIFEITLATLKGSRFDSSQETVDVPCFDINEGDWVWDGRHVHVVGVGEKYETLPWNRAFDHFLNHLPTKYGVDDALGRETLLRAALQAVLSFCGQAGSVTLDRDGPDWSLVA